MIIFSDRLLFRKVFELSQLCFNFLLVFFLCQPVQAFQGQDALLPEDMLVRYSEAHNAGDAPDQAITIAVYRTGDVFIVIPEYMQQAGHYHVLLEPEQLDGLWRLLIHEQILTFDAHTLRDMQIKKQQSLKESGAVITSVSDKAEVLLEIYPNRYQPPGLVGVDGDAVKHINWSGLRWDAENYPEMEPIQLLSEIQAFMLSILQHKDLQSVD
ncbi:hypothetical protein SAMN05216302_100393 [Nitrosomonas aestuarii]|uniref:Uncharacterized protein n=1 Tax=Nitrosomonas aestuarii TaxID=52441 RepID=A0A1I3Y9R2_9PROT|nr:hypothetical protein [Nitrosomonas aestuarii]SFK28490.1 hypothetical protein SAMN05216302_100393 [Nitrosomonas aestuarii]